MDLGLSDQFGNILEVLQKDRTSVRRCLVCEKKSESGLVRN